MSSFFITAGIVTVSLLLGITVLISHFLYIPVVLACYRYPRDGVVVSAAIALLYFAAVILLLPPLLPETLVTSGRAAMFVLIGGVISFLSLRLQAKEKQ